MGQSRLTVAISRRLSGEVSTTEPVPSAHPNAFPCAALHAVVGLRYPRARTDVHASAPQPEQEAVSYPWPPAEQIAPGCEENVGAKRERGLGYLVSGSGRRSED